LDRNGYVVSEGESQLIDLVQKIWARLAATGTLEADDLPLWPRCNGSDPYLRLDITGAAETGYRTRQCDFWDYMLSIRPN